MIKSVKKLNFINMSFFSLLIALFSLFVSSFVAYLQFFHEKEEIFITTLKSNITSELVSLDVALSNSGTKPITITGCSGFYSKFDEYQIQKTLVDPLMGTECKLDSILLDKDNVILKNITFNLPDVTKKTKRELEKMGVGEKLSTMFLIVITYVNSNGTLSSATIMPLRSFRDCSSVDYVFTIGSFNLTKNSSNSDTPFLRSVITSYKEHHELHFSAPLWKGMKELEEAKMFECNWNAV